MELDQTLRPHSGDSHFADDLHDSICPKLNLYVLEHLAKYLTTKEIKNSRLVNRNWRDGMATKFREYSMLDAGFNFRKSIPDFINRFSPDTSIKLIFQAMWIRKPKFLDDPLFVEWMKKYGDQITELKLGNLITNSDTAIQRRKKIFPSQKIKSLLLKWCHNLKVLKIVAPFYVQNSVPILFNHSDKHIKLECLQIGENKSFFSKPTIELNGMKLQGTSRFILDVLNCIKSVHTLNIIGLSAYNFDGIGTVKSNDETHTKTVLEKIQELKLDGLQFDPRQILNFFGVSSIEYLCLKKLSMKSVKVESLNLYLEKILTKVNHQLEEFVFDTSSECTYFGVTDYYALECPKFENYFSTVMCKLKVVKILGIRKWENASLEFLKLLPALEILHITKDVDATPLKSLEQPQFLNSLKRHTFINEKLKELTFKCRQSSVIDEILFFFPKLEKLEIDSNGTDLEREFAKIAKHKNIKDLTVSLYHKIEYAYFDALFKSGIEKLRLKSETRYKRRIPVSLNMIALSCLKASNLSVLELVGMKISSEEYVLVIRKLRILKNLKLSVTCINCKFSSWKTDLARIADAASESDSN